MRKLVLAPVIAAGLLLAAAPAIAAELAAPSAATTETKSDGDKPDVSPKDDPNRIVCRRERVAGSNRPVKTCMTAAEWKAQREEAARATRGGQGASRPSGGLGATPSPGV